MEKEKVKPEVKGKSDKKAHWRAFGLILLIFVAAVAYDFYNNSKIDVTTDVEYRNGLEALMSKYPNSSLFVVGIVIGLFSSLMMKLFLDQEHLKKLKKRQKELQGKLKECQKSGDTCGMEKINNEMMTVSMDMMKSSFSIKQFVITLVPFIILFGWLRKVYVDSAIFTYGGWLLRYFIAVMVSSSLYKKLFDLA